MRSHTTLHLAAIEKLERALEPCWRASHQYASPVTPATQPTAASRMLASSATCQDGNGSRFDEPVPNRVAGQLDAVAHAELLEDVRAVAIDRLLADHQGLGDLPVGVALGHELDDFGLARRQQVTRLLAVARSSQVVVDQRGDRARVQERLAADRRATGLHEVAVGDLLDDVARRPRAECLV